MRSRPPTALRPASVSKLAAGYGLGHHRIEVSDYALADAGQLKDKLETKLKVLREQAKQIAEHLGSGGP